MYTQSLRAAVIPAVHYSGFIDANLCRAVSDCPFISLGSDIAIFKFFEGGRVNNIVLADDLHFFRAIFAAVDSQGRLIESARLATAQIDVLAGRQFAAVWGNRQPVSLGRNSVVNRGIWAGIGHGELTLSAHSDAVRSIDHRLIRARYRLDLYIIIISRFISTNKAFILRGKAKNHVFSHVFTEGSIIIFALTVQIDGNDLFVLIIHHYVTIIVIGGEIGELRTARLSADFFGFAVDIQVEIAIRALNLFPFHAI